jgi:Flp pilus assembly protein TadD
VGKAYCKRDELGNAEGVFRRAIDIDPRTSQPTDLLGEVLMRLGREKEG